MIIRCIALVALIATPSLAAPVCLQGENPHFVAAHRSNYCDTPMAIRDDTIRRGWVYIRDRGIDGGVRVYYSRRGVILAVDYGNANACIVGKAH